MRFSTAVTAGLFLGLASAISQDGELFFDDGCVDDALHECFTQSLVQASSYCTASVVTAATIMEAVTVTPTVTITEQVTETVTTTRQINAKFIPRRLKRRSCGKVPLACMRNLGTFQPPQLSSACSCIGVTATTSTEFATATASDPATEIITDVTTVTTLEEVFSTSTPEPEPTTPPPRPVVANGDFQTGTTEGWSVISRTGAGDTISVIPYGANGNYALQISTSWFTQFAPVSVSFGQTLYCEATKQYKISFRISVVSSYTNGNPWSVTHGGVTLVSGAGSSSAWTQYSFTLPCGLTDASNVLAFRLQSNTNRAARLLVDDVSATLV